jgi:hypothetical protein
MISTLGIHDAEESDKATWPKVDVFVDGVKVDTLSINGPLREGTEIESEAISRALEGRQIINIAFSGNMVTVITGPEKPHS